MTARLQINPNLRLDQDYTMVDLHEDVEGDLREDYLELVQVYEPESGLVGPGWVTHVDHVEGTVTVFVDWSRLVVQPVGTASDSSNACVTVSGVNKLFTAHGRMGLGPLITPDHRSRLNQPHVVTSQVDSSR